MYFYCWRLLVCRGIYTGIKGALDRCPPLPSALRVPLVHVTLSPFFELFSLLIVIANAAVLGLERFNMPQHEIDTLRNTNYVLVLLFGGAVCCTCLTVCLSCAFLYRACSRFWTPVFFTVEIIMRWGAAGLQHWKDSVNVAEGIVLIVSVVDIAAQFSGAPPGTPLASLRVVRALRVLRLTFISSAWLRVLKRIGRVRGVIHHADFPASSYNLIPALPCRLFRLRSRRPFCQSCLS